MNRKVYITSVIFFSIFFSCRYAFALSEADDRFYVATKAYSDGFYEAAISVFNRFIDEFPTNDHVAEANLYIAKCYYNKNKYQQAETVLKEIVDTAGEKIKDEIYFWLVKVSFKAKKYDDVFRYADKVFNDYKNSKFMLETKFVTAQAYEAKNQWDKAEKVFDEIIVQGKDSKVVEKAYSYLLNYYFNQNRYDKIMELGKKYISGYPDGEFISRAYFYLGKAFTAKSDYPSAIENYEKGLAKSSDLYISDLIRQAISLVYLEKGDKEKAADFLEEITDPELKLFSVAIFHFSEKQYLDALKSFDDFLAEFPDSQYAYRVYINKAETYYEMGRINDALSLYQYVIKKYVNANDPDTNILDKAHYGLAWCYLKNGEYRRAIEEFRLTLRYTNNPVVKVSSQVQIADTYQQEKKYDLALSMYSDILSDSPGNIYSDYIQFQIAMIFLKQERLPDASLALRALESNYPNSALIPEVKYYLAIGYFSIEDYKNAEKLLETFILKYSGHYLNKKAEYLYAKCLFNLGEYKKALEKFQYIIDNYANDEITELIQIDIGNTYLNMSDMKSAGDVWRDFLVKFPSSKYADSVKLYLGGMHEINNEYDLALNYYRQVMDNENSLLADEAYFDIGHLYFMKNEHEKAKQCFNALALKNNEFAVKAKLYLVKLHSLENDNKQALKLCDEILASDSSLGAAHLEKALILKDTGKLNKAIDAFNLAVSNGVSSAKVHFLFAGTLDKAKKYHEAIDQYFKVIYEFQDSEYFIKAYFQIAKIYERQGNVPAAREIYEKIVALNVPESKIAKVRLEELNKQ